MTKIVMKFIIFIVFQYNYQNISKSFKFPRNTPIFIQFPGEFPILNWGRNSPDFQKMGKHSPSWQRWTKIAIDQPSYPICVSNVNGYYFGSNYANLRKSRFQISENV